MDEKKIITLNEEVNNMRSLMERMSIVDNGKGSISLLNENSTKDNARDIVYGLIDIVCLILSVFSFGISEGVGQSIKAGCKSIKSLTPLIKVTLKTLWNLVWTAAKKPKNISGAREVFSFIAAWLNNLLMIFSGLSAVFSIEGTSTFNPTFPIPYMLFQLKDNRTEAPVELRKKNSARFEKDYDNGGYYTTNDSKTISNRINNLGAVAGDIVFSPATAMIRRGSKVYQGALQISDFVSERKYTKYTSEECKNVMEITKNFATNIERKINQVFGIDGREYIDKHYNGVEYGWETVKDYSQKVAALPFKNIANQIIAIGTGLIEAYTIDIGAVYNETTTVLGIYTYGTDKSNPILDCIEVGGTQIVSSFLNELFIAYFEYFQGYGNGNEWANAEACANLLGLIKCIITECAEHQQSGDILSKTAYNIVYNYHKKLSPNYYHTGNDENKFKISEK